MIRALIVAASMLLASGCYVQRRPDYYHNNHAYQSCHSGQYWDGHRCHGRDGDHYHH